MLQCLTISEELTELVAASLLFSMPIIIVVAALIYKAHRTNMVRETIQQLLDKGQPIPPELFKGGLFKSSKDSDHSTDQGKSTLRNGILLIAIGLGLTLMFLQTGKWAFGMIPLLMGVGYLIIWKLEGRASQQTM